jgi:hypothetical protein
MVHVKDGINKWLAQEMLVVLTVSASMWFADGDCSLNTTNNFEYND